jgi:hypothetical protein
MSSFDLMKVIMAKVKNKKPQIIRFAQEKVLRLNLFNQ